MWVIPIMRIPVVDINHQPLMPTTPARARKWIASGKAIKRWSDCGQFYVRLTVEPLGYAVQDVVIGIDPGKKYSGIGVQSARFTLYTAHLVLPFETVRDRMDSRRLMRRGRRGRRINRKVAFSKRAHRQKQFAPVVKIEGYQTASTRKHLGLTKNKADKSKAEFNTHAVDGVAIASSYFVKYRSYHRAGEDGAGWFGFVTITPASFFVIRRPPYNRRQLHLMVPAKGGIRRKYGGSTTPFNVRKGDLIRYQNVVGYCSGYTGNSVSLSDSAWKRLGKFSSKKVELIRRSTGLIAVGG